VDSWIRSSECRRPALFYRMAVLAADSLTAAR
jgi:hypothetical protein